MFNKLNEIAREIVELYKQQLEEDGVPATGTLTNSIREYIEFEGGKFYVTLELEDYWKYVEEGRSAGRFPPIDKIRDWIIVKPVIPTSVNGKVPTTNQLAYLISRKIAEKGTEGRHSLSKVLENSTELLDRICDTIVEEYNGEIEEIIKTI